MSSIPQSKDTLQTANHTDIRDGSQYWRNFAKMRTMHDVDFDGDELPMGLELKADGSYSQSTDMDATPPGEPCGLIRVPHYNHTSGPRIRYSTDITNEGKPIQGARKTQSPKFCIKCHKAAPKRCSRCHLIYYCSTACQKRDWPHHKHICTKS